LRSSDHGATFDTTEVTALFKAHGNGMGRQSGEKLAVDPHNGKNIWCGSRLNGLFRSVDGGKTWAKADTLGAKSGGSLNNDNGISFVLFDSAGGTVDGATKTFYVGIGRTGNNFYRTTDGGKTFAAIAGGPAGLMPLRAVFAGRSLLISYAGGPGPHSVTGGAIHRYSTVSGAWTNITPKDEDGYYGDGSQARGGALGGISVDPADTAHLVASTLCHYGGQWRFADSTDGWGDKLFESKDGGASWRLLNTYAEKSFSNPSVDPDGTEWIHGKAVHWAGSVEFDPFDTRRVWVTSGNGVFRSDDISVTNPVWKFAARGIEEVVPFEALSIPDGPMLTAIGDYDGAAYADISKSYRLYSPEFGTTLSLGYAPLDNKLLRVGTQSDWSTGTEIKTDVGYLSSDLGKTWTRIAGVPAGKGMTAMNADGTVYFHRAEAASSIQRSADGGATWAKLSGIDEGQTQSSPLVPDPVDPKVLYILDAQGNLWTTTDAGLTFAKRGSVQDNAESLWQASSGKIVARPGVSGELWIPLDQAQTWTAGGYSRNGLAWTTDGGRTFARIDTSLVQVCVAVGLGKAAPGATYPTLFLWGSADHGPIGMYRSTDKGASWIRINDAAHQFGGVGNGQLVKGDWNVFGRVYMSSAGRGLVYGEPGGTNSVGSRTARAASLRREGTFVTGNVGDEIRLLDLRGRLLRRSEVVAGAARLDLSGLPRGIFVARTATEALAVETAR
jgi:xyloglucan-specific exo-beta-1,4-glucanase